MIEAGDGPLDQLAEGLSSEQRSEFFQALHQAGITRQDVELARLLRALQLYKAFYEEIPSRVSQALKDADTWSTRICSLHESMAARLDSALIQLERNTEAASRISNQFREARTLLAAAINKSVKRCPGDRVSYPKVPDGHAFGAAGGLSG